MKRVLIITYYWPPTGGSGVQRWVKFAKFLPSFGWQPVIYTPENPERLAVDESLLADIPPCTEVLKTHISEPYDFYRKVLKFFGSGRGCAPTGNGNQGEVNPINARKKGFIKKLSVLIRGNCFIPDPRTGWVKPSVSYLKKYLEEHPVDAVVTTGPPQSMHLIGLGLMKALRRKAGGTEDKVPEWIVDFRDPWTEMFYFKHLGLLPLARRKHKRLEKEVLDNADKVIAVTPLVQADFQAMTSTPVELVTNGFDEDDFPVSAGVAAAGRPLAGQDTATSPSIAEPGRFTLLHAGLFASDGNPEALWKALGSMVKEDKDFAENFHLVLCGKTDNHAEVLGAYAFHQVLQAFTFRTRSDFLRDGNVSSKRHQDHIATRQGYVSSHTRALGRDGLLCDLHQNLLPLGKHVPYLAVFIHDRLEWEIVDVFPFVLHRQRKELVPRRDVRAEVQIMQKSILVGANRNESGIEAGIKSMDFADIDVTDGKFFRGSFTMQFDQFLVFEQGDLYVVVVMGSYD